jgi:hypothetical protein
MRNPSQRIETLIAECERLALDYVEQTARRILRTLPHLDEFVMGMGGAMFSTTVGENLGLEERAYFRPLCNFLFHWDDTLKLTGIPMRFTAYGPKVSDW